MSPEEGPREVICAISWSCHSIGMFSTNLLVNEVVWILEKEVKKTFNKTQFI